MLPAAEATAQSCKPIRANRGKAVFDAKVVDVATSFVNPYNPRQTVEQRGYDVIVREGSSELARYQTDRQGNLLSRYVAYQKGGVDRVDTLHPSRRGKHNFYFGYYTSHNVASTYFPTQRKTVYYNTRGYDSMTEARYPNGVLNYRTYHAADGTTYRSMQWTADGILVCQSHGGNERTYYPTGILQTRVIHEKSFVIRTELYHENGVLQAITWRQRSEAVGTWRFYDSTGKALRTERYRPTTTVEPGVVAIQEVRPHVEIQQRVEQMPEFPAAYNLRDSLGGAVAKALPCSRAPLVGRYEVEFVLQTDGIAKVIAMHGQDAEVLRPTLETFFAQLRGWKPARRNGRLADSIMQFTCTVQ